MAMAWAVCANHTNVKQVNKKGLSRKRWPFFIKREIKFFLRVVLVDTLISKWFMLIRRVFLRVFQLGNLVFFL